MSVMKVRSGTWLLMLPGLMWLGLLMVLPCLLVFVLIFFERDIYGGIDWQAPTLDNIARVLRLRLAAGEQPVVVHSAVSGITDRLDDGDDGRGRRVEGEHRPHDLDGGGHRTGPGDRHGGEGRPLGSDSASVCSSRF